MTINVIVTCYHSALIITIGASTDFTAVSMPLSYPAGTSDGANDQCITLMTVDDNIFERSETIIVELTNLIGAIASENTTTVTIIDNDG